MKHFFDSNGNYTPLTKKNVREALENTKEICSETGNYVVYWDDFYLCDDVSLTIPKDGTMPEALELLEIDAAVEWFYSLALLESSEYDDLEVKAGSC